MRTPARTRYRDTGENRTLLISQSSIYFGGSKPPRTAISCRAGVIMLGAMRSELAPGALALIHMATTGGATTDNLYVHNAFTWYFEFLIVVAGPCACQKRKLAERVNPLRTAISAFCGHQQQLSPSIITRPSCQGKLEMS